MTRLLWLLLATAHSCACAYVTEPPSFAKRLDRLYEKLERFTLSPRERYSDKLNAKLDKLDALTPDKLADEDEELVSMMQLWGDMSDEQVRDVIKELQKMREDDEKGDKLADGEYSEDWNDEDTFLQELGEGDYAMDGEGSWDPLDDPDASTSKPGSVIPSAITKPGNGYREIVVSAVDPVAATNERPRILDDSNLTPAERHKVRQAALANMANVMRAGKCLTPQPRWLPVRQLAPAADTVYMPPCVLLHRCAPDSGCCHSESEVCAPIDGKYVTVPFYLSKVDGNLTFARMLFFNHTSCACVSRETLQSTARTKIDPHPSTEGQERTRERAWRQTTEEPLPEKDEGTPPPQLRRCTCPVLFSARLTAGGSCTCGCDSSDTVRRRDCQWLAKGREHFGLRDRVCVASGDCTPPNCEVGRYDKKLGRCPLYRPRQFRRIRYHRSRHQEKPAEPST